MSRMCQTWNSFQPFSWGPSKTPGTSWVLYAVFGYEAFAGDTVSMNLSLPQGSDGDVRVVGSGGLTLTQRHVGGGFTRVSYRLPHDVEDVQLGFTLVVQTPKTRQTSTVSVGCTGPCRLPSDNGGGIAGELLGRLRCVTAALSGAPAGGHTSHSAVFTPAAIQPTTPVAAATGTAPTPLSVQSVPTTSATPTAVVEAPMEPASAAEAVVVTAP